MSIKNKREVILLTSPHCRYYVNINAESVAPLYNYYRQRIGTPQFPPSDIQRHEFEKIIINMCRYGMFNVPHWVLNNSRIGVFTNPQWWELTTDLIPKSDGNFIPYAEVREEVRFIHHILIAKRRGKVHILDDDAAEILDRIERVDAHMANDLIRATKERLDA